MNTKAYKLALTDIMEMESGDFKAKLDKNPSLAQILEKHCPLIIQAVYFEERSCSKYLLEKGADPNAVNNPREMITPIHLAALLASEPLIDILLKAGADPKRINADGLTPLDYIMETLIAYAMTYKAFEAIYGSDLPVNENDYRAGYRFIGYLLEYKLLNSTIKIKTEPPPLYGALANKLYSDSLHGLGGHWDKFEKLIPPGTREIFQLDFGALVRLGDEAEPEFLDDVSKSRPKDDQSHESNAQKAFDHEISKITAGYQKSAAKQKKANFAKKMMADLCHNALEECQELYNILTDSGWRSSDINRWLERANSLGLGALVKDYRVNDSGLKRSDGALRETSFFADGDNDSQADNLIDVSRAVEADEALRINRVKTRETRALKDVLKELDQQFAAFDSRLPQFFNPGLSSFEIRALIYSESINPDLITLYGWHNGFSGQAGQSNPLLGEYRFLPLAEALALREQMRPLIPVDALPIMINEVGDWMDLSISGEGPYKDLFCIADHDDLPSFYPSVAAYFAALTTCFRERTFSIKEKAGDNGSDLLAGRMDQFFAINDRYILSRREDDAGDDDKASESQYDPDCCETLLPN